MPDASCTTAPPHRSFEVTVECSAGYRGEEAPRRFRIGERWIAVADVLDRWLDPDHRYFKLLGEDGDLYILRHDPEGDAWELTLYRSGDLLRAEEPMR